MGFSAWHKFVVSPARVAFAGANLPDVALGAGVATTVPAGSAAQHLPEWSVSDGVSHIIGRTKMSSQDRLSSTSYIVLSLIDAAGEATPYDLKRAVAASIGNFWSVPHAQVYAEPERLAAAGYLSERREQGGRRRRYYKLQPRGEEALRAWRAEPTAEMAELRDPGILKLFFGGDPKPLAEAQLSVHRRRLDELEELTRRVGEQPQVPPGVALTFRAGLGHEREWVAFWEAIARGEAP